MSESRVRENRTHGSMRRREATPISRQRRASGQASRRPYTQEEPRPCDRTGTDSVPERVVLVAEHHGASGGSDTAAMPPARYSAAGSGRLAAAHRRWRDGDGRSRIAQRNQPSATARARAAVPRFRSPRFREEATRLSTIPDVRDGLCLSPALLPGPAKRRVHDRRCACSTGCAKHGSSATCPRGEQRLCSQALSFASIRGGSRSRHRMVARPLPRPR